MRSNSPTLPSFVRHFVYHPRLRAIVKSLGLGKAARRAYGMVVTEIVLHSEGLSARFKTSPNCNIEFLDFVADAEKELLHQVLSRLNPHDVFWDVGAQWGIYSILAAKRADRTVAFEPFPASLETLRTNIARNRLSNITVSAVALGDKNGDVYMLHSEDTCPQVSETGDLLVRAARGDDLIDAGTFPAPTAIKLDVEGYEVAVLKGLSVALTSPSCRLVACEIHPQFLPPGASENTVICQLRDSGFKIVWELRRGPEVQVVAVKGDD